MSLQDFNSFHNGSGGGITSYRKSNEEMDNIFEEIEELLKHNEGLEIPAKAATTAPRKTPLANFVNSNNATDAANFDFLPACDNEAFLISSDTQVLPEEELSLYSVNQNELQPVNAPFMVPGIYKKIANAPLTSSDCNKKNAATEATNVFFTTKRAKGKIISRNQFENCSGAEESKEQYGNSEQENCMADANSKGIEISSSDILLKLASSILKSAPNDQLEIDRNKNEVKRTQPNSSRRIIYHLLGPEDVDLDDYPPNTTASEYISLIQQQQDIHRPFKLKRGRPRKLPMENANEQIPPSLPKKIKVEQNAKEAKQTEANDNFQRPLLRTRSGRVVKSVKPQTHDVSSDGTQLLELDPTKDLIEDAKDKDFSVQIKEDPPLSTSSATEIVNKRRVPPESICPKCGKIFLGRRLKRHFTQHPDHMLASITEQQPPVQESSRQQVGADIENPNEEITLFHFLISKLKNPLLNEDQRADLFLNELNDLIEQLQLRNTRLIRNTSGLHFVSARTARVLGIPEGQYALDMSAIETDAPLMDNMEQHSYNGEEQKRQRLIATNVNTPSIDYNAISLDNTLTDEAAQKLNLSAGGKLLPPSEESLLRAVDDLVHDGITKLVDANLLQPPRAAVQSSVASSLVSSHYDHVSDNAVEALTIKENNITQEGAPILGLAVDFFQFKNN
ncbi:uncharacterized protein [Eurosta solidaginis]|uniref:uncharacterized protein n=1 Tax=Eurosta solidaginis TaxID=178769 RepID=UPI0035308689